MGIFSFGKKNKKKQDSAVESVDIKVKKHLYLHVSPMGWKSLFLDETGKQVGPPGSWAENSDEVDNDKRMENSLKDVVQSLSSQLNKSDKIFLLIDGASVSFSDNKPPPLVAHSGLMARKFGEDLLNSPEVTFGFAEFPIVKGTIHEKRHGLYAFADAQLIRSTLALLDKDGFKVIEMIPKSYMMVQRAFIFPDAPYGAIQIESYSSTIVLVNPFLGTVVIRHIPVGVLTFATAVAKKIMMDVNDTLKALGQGNKMKEVYGNKDKPDTKTDISLHQSTQAQAIQPHALALLSEFNETIQFFTYQRVSGIPAKFETFGEIDRISGLREWLEKHLDEQLNVKLEQGPNLLEIYSKAERPMPCNLLKGSDKSLLTIGRNHFHYTENRGFIPQKEFNKQKPLGGKKNESEKDQKDAKSSSRNRRRLNKSGGKGGGRNRGGKSSESFSLSTLFSSFSKKGGRAEVSKDLDEEQQDRQYFALFGLLFFAILYWGWNETEILQKRYNNYSASFLQNRHSHANLLKQVREVNNNINGVASTENLTKILWTEKFLSLARLMDNHIWLTDIYLGKENRQVRGANVESTKMVIEGRVLPSTIGHIRKIAIYLDKILQDKNGFMSDFRTITFEGAELEGMENDAIINFTFQAWYDKNKRIEFLQSNPDQIDISKKKKQPGLEEMKVNINKHNQQLAPLVGGKKKR
ncbi:MAG: hypothetical protein HQL71_14395 [Magnetococcales bacterium]|nr:hypothetical protein [Magnetococcales bacterium]